jgi:plasmid stabilization system protein ParE
MKKQAVKLTEQAKSDILHQAQYYEKQQHNLGKEFLEKVESTLLRIEENPKQFPKIYRKVRKAIVNKFPHKVLFVVEKIDAIVIAVFHQSQNPKLLKERATITKK